MGICGYKKGTTNFFSPLSCCCFWIRDPGSGMGKNQDPGSATLSNTCIFPERKNILASFSLKVYSNFQEHV